ncbi:hypothetical protein [Streptomyces albireticuli]|uniref:hypothetical protein n=1 Tax=Streptomyces albireticuli TaxID=1940 RepID=UPI0011811324|nr:hypothetical protein [Streptomyces albireticuli]MCD9194620.1 hypothetical protein [Streptomyces albireticuli]
MNRALSATLAVGALLLPLTLTACGTERGDAPPPASAGRQAKAADRSALEARARAIGTTADMVYVIDVPGFSLAEQSVGVSGDDGFSGSYVATGAGPGKGGPLTVRAERRPRRDCGGSPDGGGGTKETCEREGELVFRTTGEEREYELVDDGRTVTVSARTGDADREILRKAVRSLHRADDEELDRVLPPLRDRPEMPRRGDLPSYGDGAPDNRPRGGGG